MLAVFNLSATHYHHHHWIATSSDIIMSLSAPPPAVYPDLAGKYDPKGKNSTVHTLKQRTNTASKKCDCLMKVVLRQAQTRQEMAQ
jgi:hypothetical protein